MPTLFVRSYISPFGSETPLPSLADAVALVTRCLAADLHGTGVHVELEEAIMCEEFDASSLASARRPLASGQHLLVIPPHGRKAFAAAAKALAGSPAVVFGLNGGADDVATNVHAFNIGIHDAALRELALRRVLEGVGHGADVIRLSDAPSEGVLDLNMGRAELVDAIRRRRDERSDGVLHLSLASSANGPTAMSIIEDAGFRGTLIRDRGSSFPVPDALEVIDIVGSFVDLPTLEYRSLIRRALGPLPDGDPLLHDLMTVGWRLDAVQICAAALAADPHLPLGESLLRYRSGGEVFNALTRQIAFSPNRLNTRRSVAIVRRGHDSGWPHLYPFQLTEDGPDAPVAFTSCKALWIGDIDPAKGAFSADLELDVSSAAPLEIEDLVFVNAGEVPEVTPGPAPRRSADAGESRFGLHARVRGTFRFDPEVSDYPFDQQRLPILIEIREQGRTRPIQPVPLRGARTPHVEGWDVEDTELARSLACRPVPHGPDAVDWVESQSVVFAVVVRRRVRDALIRTAIPLALLLLLAWATGFWSDGGQVAGILVNAFLACVALYFAEPKPVPGRTTFIDRLFIVCNVMVGLKLVLVVATFGLDDPDSGLLLLNRISLVALPLAVLGSLAVLWPRRKRNMRSTRRRS